MSTVISASALRRIHQIENGGHGWIIEAVSDVARDERAVRVIPKAMNDDIAKLEKLELAQTLIMLGLFMTGLLLIGFGTMCPHETAIGVATLFGLLLMGCKFGFIGPAMLEVNERLTMYTTTKFTSDVAPALARRLPQRCEDDPHMLLDALDDLIVGPLMFPAMRNTDVLRELLEDDCFAEDTLALVKIAAHDNSFEKLDAVREGLRELHNRYVVENITTDRHADVTAVLDRNARRFDNH